LNESSPNGRMFTYFGQFILNVTKVAHISVFTYFLSIEYVIILTKNCMGYFFGAIFFSNSSGHLASQPRSNLPSLRIRLVIYITYICGI
jgi:hypothetical protein